MGQNPTVGVCAIFKNEAPFLREWVLYHRLIEVDYFVLYDNCSTDDGATVLSTSDLRPFVSVLPWHIQCGQMPAYNHFIRHFALLFDWVAFIDIDEFIVPSGSESLKATLGSIKQHTSLLLHWANFGPGEHIRRPGGLVTAAYQTRLPTKDPIHRHVKSIVKSTGLLGCDHPHVFYQAGRCCDALGNTVPNDPIQNVVQHQRITLNHYYTRSLEDWRCKVLRGRATTTDPNAQREPGMFNYHAQFANVHDSRVQKFVPDLHDAVQYGLAWS